MEDLELERIDKKEFEFVQTDACIFDAVPKTKPVGFYRDAFRRFKKNKASVAGACIILFLILFSAIVPIFASFPLSFYEPIYKNAPPKNIFASGIKRETLGLQTYEKRLAIGIAANDFHLVGKPQNTPISTKEQGLTNPYSVIKELLRTEKTATGTTDYIVKTDMYKAVGFMYLNIPNEDEYQAMKRWQAENDIPILFPVLDKISPNDPIYKEPNDINVWYKIDKMGRTVYDKDGNFIPNYLIDSNGNYTDRTPSGEARVLAENWFIYKYGKAPSFMLGTDSSGRDILIRLALGIRTSMLLATFVTVVCFLIGAVIGSIMGYFGGTLDLVLQHLIGILAGIPFLVIIILVRQNWIETGKLSPFFGLFFVFVVTGWIGNAGLLRAQFYRFKNKEYVLAARTLGAKDRRIMFKHIFPNTLGTIITSIALDIPSFIFGETQLSYLGILKLDTQTTASIGGMLAAGQKVMYTHPNGIFWPALVISLLMISFNLFGNGLRDAFNPQLRGVE